MKLASVLFSSLLVSPLMSGALILSDPISLRGSVSGYNTYSDYVVSFTASGYNSEGHSVWIMGSYATKWFYITIYPFVPPEIINVPALVGGMFFGTYINGGVAMIDNIFSSLIEYRIGPGPGFIKLYNEVTGELLASVPVLAQFDPLTIGRGNVYFNIVPEAAELLTTPEPSAISMSGLGILVIGGALIRRTRSRRTLATSSSAETV